ncbi:hypothetical protein BCR43DRAFT_562021 [Syncephalastrum racemosum]|uniref:Late embryogenesis abundant protein LEA-2 subgroup domain-containing protein n=1 Tax=Syncephalastrum racemosum TaxID=13706 RepID=A0A1X2HHF2_SYNRA|nr:hypothetical protein BCR43DRAFT_562021 [Syncephalastrum racemosum]
MPTIDFGGVTNAPNNQSQLTVSGNTFDINFGLLIHVQNPNVVGFDLSSINATAYYPEAGSEPVGGGFMDHQYVPRYSNFNFTYPFAIKYNAAQDTDRTLLHLLVQKCGLTGGQPQQLTINYVINLAVKVLFVTVHPTITDSTSFVCPVQSGASLPGLLANNNSPLAGLLASTQT